MRHISVLLIYLLTVSCHKKDLLIFKHIEKTENCVVESFNAEKQNSSDVYVLKTLTNYGQVTHFKAQVRDVNGMNYVYEYNITYGFNRAILKGSTKAIWWVLDNPPEDPDAYVDPDAPKHPEEDVSLRDTSTIEVILDSKTRYPLEVKNVNTGESLLKLKYDNRGYLSHVNNYIVTTDASGNILKILTPPLVEEEPYYGPQQLGIWYNYSENELPANSPHYYETPNVFISPMYSILEILNWGPIQPHRERTEMLMQIAYGEEYLPSPFLYVTYTNHQYDDKGKLIGYQFDGDIKRYLPYSGITAITATRSINWHCRTQVRRAK